MENYDIEISNKHIPLRIVGFVLALTVAVLAFSYGIMGIGRKETGYQLIEATADEEAAHYTHNISFYYYFDGSSDEIKASIKALTAAYSPALQRSYKLLDAEEEYTGYNNLATLNARPGEDVQVGAELCRVLSDAWEKTQEQKGFNMFAGALYRAWDDILYLEEPGEYDPLVNETEQKRLRRLAEASNDLSNFDLLIVDAEKGIVHFEVSAAYVALLEELEVSGPILDLNLMRDAYELLLVSEALENAGYRDGYLSAASGMTVSLSENSRGEFCFYSQAAGATTPAAMIPAQPGVSASQFRAFPREEGEAAYYSLEGHLRHPYHPASGSYRDVLLGSFVLAESPVAACYMNIQMQEQETAEELRAYVLSSDAAIAYTLQDDDSQTVYVSSAEFSAAADYGWQLQPLA